MSEDTPTLDYAPPPESSSSRRVARTLVYTLTATCTFVLTVALFTVLASTGHHTPTRTAAVLTAGAVLTAALALTVIGRAGCVTAFLALALITLILVWLSV